MIPELSDSFRRFQQEMESVDEVVHVLLKGHLLIEEALTRIIEQYLFHRQHLSDARLTFKQKMTLCRALCLRKHELGEWELIGAINALRNEVAHRLSSPEREKKLARVKELYFKEATEITGPDEVRKKPDSVVLFYACAHCAGFLASYESDSKAFRKMVHSMDRALNNDLPEFEC
jgi:hypothetical protein